MRIPKGVTIGPVVYKIVAKARKEWKYPNLVGVCRRGHDGRVVEVLKDQEVSDFLWTLFHELFHAVWADRVDTNTLTALLKTADRQVLIDEIEESVVEALSAGVLSMFADNPKLLPLLEEYVESRT